MSGKKELQRCIYCSNTPDGEEHWLPRSLGAFRGNTLLTGRICRSCNVRLGQTLDLELVRTGHTGMIRDVLGIGGRLGHDKKAVFDYKASNPEPPIQVHVQRAGSWKPTPLAAISMNPDGTMKAVQRRTLTIRTSEGERDLPFPRGWGATQLRAGAKAFGLLGGKVVRAHAEPPETAQEFIEASLDTIRAVFGPSEIEVFQTNLASEPSPVEPTLVRFTLTREYFRAVAKVAFHYFLWLCPTFGGDEPEFGGIRDFVSGNAGDVADFVQTILESVIDRASPEHGGTSGDLHAFVAYVIGDLAMVMVVFFSRSSGVTGPTFRVRLGKRPGPLAEGWRRCHIALYADGIPGHAGELRELEST